MARTSQSAKCRGGGIDARRSLLCVSLVLIVAESASAQADTIRVSVDSSGVQGDGTSQYAAISADGQIVAFASLSDNFASPDKNGTWDVFVFDRSTGITERASVSSSGFGGNGQSSWPSLSADGRLVAFSSYASNLVANDGNGVADLFVRDRVAGTTERVSVDSSGAEGDGDSGGVISANGQIAAFGSFATNLVAGDTNGFMDVFVHDRSSGITERVSVDSAGVEANGDSEAAASSDDGEFIAFDSGASNLVAGDSNGTQDIFVHDRATGLTERVSVDSSGAEGNGSSFLSSISADGRFVAFESDASNLVPGDMNGRNDIFVRDRATGATERVSVDSVGGEADGDSYGAWISSDGLKVTFYGSATNLVAGDTNGYTDVFLHDRVSGVTTRVSTDSSGSQGNHHSFTEGISADGEVVVFSSVADNLVTGDTNVRIDVFVHDLCGTPASWSNYGSGFPGTNGVASFTPQQNPVFGATLTLDLANSYGSPTVGVLFVGFQRASIRSNWGGDLLVVPALTQFVTFSYGANSYTGTISDDEGLCGVTIDLQAIEADPGAAKGVSFTPGLELVIGH